MIMYVNGSNFLKLYFPKQTRNSRKSCNALYFLQISLMLNLIEDREILIPPSAFDLLWNVLAEVHEEKQPYRPIVGKVSYAGFGDSCDCFCLMLPPKLTSSSFLEVSCQVGSATLSMKFLYSVTLKSLVSHALRMDHLPSF